MTAPVQDFAFFVGNIEDGMIAILEAAVGKDAEEGYAGDITTYSGELDDEEHLREAMGALAGRFPLFLVSYGEGKSTRQTQIAPGVGAPWSVRHDCTFIVMCLDDDARGETERRRGAYNMASDVLAALENKQLHYVDGDIKITLTPGEFISRGVNHLGSFSDVTAYAVPFDVYFNYLTPDRRNPEQEIDEIVFELNPLNPVRRTTGLPGVTVSIEE